MLGLRLRAMRGDTSANPNPLLITAILLGDAARSAVTKAMDSEASVVKTKRAASLIRAGCITGLKSPEICDQKTLRIGGNSVRARHSNIRG